MSLKQVHSVYFIGIGGIGMSALAKYFFANGKEVAGYDKISSPITKALASEGIKVHFEDAIHNIDQAFLDNERTLIVYTPAVPKTHKQLTYFKKNGFKVYKRAEILGEITKSTFCFGVAGTHGKTTTSSILGHIMEVEKATSFLGGIAENYNSNLILGEDKITVVEADEFDRSFLHLSPNIACITSMDADHLDIYGAHDELNKSFHEFAEKVTDQMVVAKGLEVGGLTYAVEESADYQAYDLRVKDGTFEFDVKTPKATIKDIRFNLPGRHNMMNALAALAMADIYGVSLDKIKERLRSFKGVQRRFSYKIKNENIVLIDDYAHHPTEINAVDSAIKEMYPEAKVLVVFQPHLFSRTRDFIDDFAKALSNFEDVILLDIYPARELPIEGVTSSWLLTKIKTKNKQLSSKKALIENINKIKPEVVVMLGAGDIGLLVNDVKEELIKQFGK